MTETLDSDNKFSLEKQPVKIRRMREDDAQAVFALAENCGLDFWSSDDYKREAERQDAFAVVAEINNKKVGFLAARLIMFRASPLSKNQKGRIKTVYSGRNIELDDDKDIIKDSKYGKLPSVEAEINNFAVEQEFRKQGIGGILLNSLVGCLLQYETGQIWLEVRESNEEALNFYRAKNFIICGSRKNFYKNPFENALLLSRKIHRCGT